MKDGIYWVTEKGKNCPIVFKKSTMKNADDPIAQRFYGASGDESFECGFFADFHSGYAKRGCLSIPEFEIEFDVIEEIVPPCRKNATNEIVLEDELERDAAST